MNGNKFKKGLILMNKTLALFVTVMIILVTSCIYTYATMPKYTLPTAEKVEITEVKEDEPVVRKKEVEQTKKQSYLFKYPKYGMKEKYIDQTSLGKHDSVKINYDTLDSSVISTKVYYWKNSDGTNLAYAITNRDYSTGERTVSYFVYEDKIKSAPPKNISEIKSPPKSSNSNDPYNAKDYGYADDFYDEYYDDFYDYEDAEDYWMWNQ